MLLPRLTITFSVLSTFNILARVSFEVPIRQARSAFGNVIRIGHRDDSRYRSASNKRFNNSRSFTVVRERKEIVFTHTVNSRLRYFNRIFDSDGDVFSRAQKIFLRNKQNAARLKCLCTHRIFLTTQQRTITKDLSCCMNRDDLFLTCGGALVDLHTAFLQDEDAFRIGVFFKDVRSGVCRISELLA